MPNSPRIFYSIWMNDGGLTQVALSMLDLLEELNQFCEFNLIIFNGKEIASNKNIFQIQLKGFDHTEETLVYTSQILQDKFNFDRHCYLIADETTLPLWKDIEIDYYYDIHLLQRELYSKLKKIDNIHTYDKHMNSRVLTLLLADELKRFLYEGRLLNKAKGFVSNSLCSINHLKNHYPKEVKDKKIFHIPVYSTMKFDKKYSQPDFSNKSLYNCARSHPQKGHHFFFDSNWNDLPIYLRGFWPGMYDEDVVEKAQAKGINILGWSDDIENLKKEFLDYTFHVFPSIYEPWGLSLEESLSAGRICIANRNDSGHEEQIVHGENGFLIDFNVSTLKEKIFEILNMSPAVLNAISINAAKTHFDRRRLRLEGFKKMINYLSNNI